MTKKKDNDKQLEPKGDQVASPQGTGEFYIFVHVANW